MNQKNLQENILCTQIFSKKADELPNVVRSCSWVASSLILIFFLFLHIGTSAHILHGRVGSRAFPDLVSGADFRGLPASPKLARGLTLRSLPFVKESVVTKKVKGKVTNAAKQPLIGVTVKVVGGSTGVSTDSRGMYEINVPENGSLQFSYVGYQPQTVSVSGRTNIDIVMKDNSHGLNELVVVGYGSTKKKDLTGAVATVKGAALQELPAASLNQQLSGKATGVAVSVNSGRPGGRATIKIRGSTSLSNSNNPLYVIDGVILNTKSLANGTSPIDFINPNDILSMEVLKDASSTAIYGARGANGVILVTTKRGSSGGGRVNYDAYVSFGVLPRELGVLNSTQFLQVEDIAYQNAQKFDPIGWAANKYSDPKLKRTDPRLFDANGKPKYNTDWQKEATQTAITQNHSLALTGGSEKGSYGMFLNYRDENGLIKDSWQKRYAARFVIDNQVNKWLKTGGDLSYTYQLERQVDPIGNEGISVMRQVLEEYPIIPVKYPDGSWGGNEDYPGAEGGGNPIQIIKELSYNLNTQTVLGNVYSNIKLMDGLDFKTTLGVNTITQRTDEYDGRNLNFISRDVSGRAQVTVDQYNSWQFENYLTYNKNFNKIHSLNAVGGISWQKVNSYRVQANTQGFGDDFFNVNNLAVGASPGTPTSIGTAYTLNSYFFRANYTLKDKYLFTVTGRADGSSKFGTKNKFGFFPSAALAWKASEEEFIKKIHWISNLKIRSSYGQTGNAETDSIYAAQGSLGVYTVIRGGARASGIGIGSLPNEDLKWEKTAMTDGGIELGLFNNRIALEVDAYYKKTTNMLLNAPLPTSSGYATAIRNVGSMRNKGIEIALNTVNIQNKNFTWSTLLSLSTNSNKVLKLTGGSDIFIGRTVVREGQPVGSFFGLENLGVYGNSPEQTALAKKYGKLPGSVRYKDVNNDGVINDADRVIIGNGIPKGLGTFQNTFKYKNFDLMVDLQFQYGNDIFSQSIHTLEDRTGIANSYTTVLNAWTPEHQNTPIAQLRPTDAGYDTQADSHKISNGSFLRGRNALLGYNFPSAVLSKLKLSKLRLYCSMQNFFVLTKFKGYDPEVAYNTDAFNQGFSLYDYPKPRTFLVGINIGL